MVLTHLCGCVLFSITCDVWRHHSYVIQPRLLQQYVHALMVFSDRNQTRRNLCSVPQQKRCTQGQTKMKICNPSCISYLKHVGGSYRTCSRSLCRCRGTSWPPGCSVCPQTSWWWDLRGRSGKIEQMSTGTVGLYCIFKIGKSGNLQATENRALRRTD